uniref:Transcription factor IIIC 90kDa subunit N-terminal domain-containing protein n=1 Tax=Heliothis virescens TaxID=7102 RepID=A0A2A4IZU7_HELVI
MTQETYFELAKRPIPIIKNESSRIKWRNSVITVLTNKRIHFLKYAFNLECLERHIDFNEYSMVSPRNSPATDVCNAKFLKSGMRNVDYTEMIVNSAFWPHNPALTQEMTSAVMVKWSPLNKIKGESVLAVLNNIGGVEFLKEQLCEWTSILNLSPYILKVLEYNKAVASFEELKEAVYILETSAICWATEFNPNNSCYFVTAQKNGTVLFWQLFDNMDYVKVRGRIETNMKDITAIKWVPKSENSFFLICADVLGQIYAYDMQIESENISLVNGIPLWPHKDRMIAISLKYTIINDHIVFLCGKHRHLVVQAIDNKGKILSEYVNNINDHRITDICYTEDGIYLSTVNVKIYKINIVIENSKLNVILTQLHLKDPYSTYELYSLQFSRNNVVCALAVTDRKVLSRKEAYRLDVIFISTESKLESMLPTLLNNPTKKLTYYWDCIELLRFQMNKLRILPKLDFCELYEEAKQDLYKLKIYFILMIYFTNMRKVLRIHTEITLPETSKDIVRERILYLHAKALLNNLCNKFKKEGNLNYLDMETLQGSKKYLEFYSKKYRTEIGLDDVVRTHPQLFSRENKCEYVCQGCDEKLEGLTCKDGHLNMFCMVTFTPIMSDDYLYCRCCGSTARSDLENGNVLCVFCDLYLIKPD